MGGPSLDLHGAAFRHTEVQQPLQLRELRTPGADFLALQGITGGLLVDTMRGFLLNTDGDAHAHVRRLVSGAFTTRRVEQFRPAVARIAEDLVAGLATARCAPHARTAPPSGFRRRRRCTGRSACRAPTAPPDFRSGRR